MLDNLDKYMIISRVIHSYCNEMGIPLTSVQSLFILISVRRLNPMYSTVTDYSVSCLLRANKHAMGFKQINERLVILRDAGYILLSGPSSKTIRITSLGLSVLSDLNKLISKAKFKYRISQLGY